MSYKNSTPWGGIIVAIILLLTLGWVCNYLEEQTSRMSGFANTLVGLLIVGAFFWGYSAKK